MNLNVDNMNNMNYWLSHNGTVYENDNVGCHYDMANDIIIDKFPELLDAYCLKHGQKLYLGKDAVAELENRGYTRYMGWLETPRWVIYNQKPTKKQQEKMFKLTGFIYVE